jgi:iron complex outermembrane receptor protein
VPCAIWCRLRADGPQTSTTAPVAQVQADEIVVTAQRRTERAQDVPISISALSGTTLGGGKTTTIADFATKVPGLQFNQVFQSSNPTIFLRGVGVNDYNAASSGAVGISIDDVFMNSGVGQLAGMFDVDRVEVLKGPQGTLFGRNTTGGILNIYTKRPTFDTQADASLNYGRFNQVFIDAGIGGTLVKDLVAFRVSGTYHRRDGWIRNEYNGQTGNDVDNLGGRIQLLVTPASNFTIDLKVEASRSDTSAIRGKSGGTYTVAAKRNCTGAESGAQRML